MRNKMADNRSSGDVKAAFKVFDQNGDGWARVWKQCKFMQKVFTFTFTGIASQMFNINPLIQVYFQCWAESSDVNTWRGDDRIFWENQGKSEKETKWRCVHRFPITLLPLPHTQTMIYWWENCLIDTQMPQCWGHCNVYIKHQIHTDGRVILRRHQTPIPSCTVTEAH